MNASPHIHLYRPQRTNPEHLEAVFVAREALVEEIVGTLGRWRPSASRQHYLLIGPRGIGKTCLLRILEHRISQGPLSARWVPVMLPEEGYGIRSVADLLVKALEAASAQTEDASIHESYERVRRDSDDQRVIDLGLDAFRRFHKDTGKCVLLMLENANRVLDRQLGHGTQTHLLRKILIEEDWLVMAATSPTYVNAVTEPEEPLFEFFQVKLLGELTFDEQTSMLQKLARLEHNEAFEEYLRKFLSCLHALYHFTGGNPRLAVMLYDLIAHQKITDVQAELDSLLDQLTPFYQDRMRDLAGQEAQLLEQMALLPEGCTPTELAQEARMEAKTVRALLSRLEAAGYVRKEPRRKKRTVYIIPERFFRIWHQMSHSREARGRIQYLLEFFSTWYATREERDQVWEELAERFGEGMERDDDDRVEDFAEYMEYIAAVSEGHEKYEREFENLRRLISRKGMTVFELRLAELDREHEHEPVYHFIKGCFLVDIVGDAESASVAFDTASRLEPEEGVGLYYRAMGLRKTGNDEEADRFYGRAGACLTRLREGGPSQETIKGLLCILSDANNRTLVRTATAILGRIADETCVEEIASTASMSKDSWRKQYCARALGEIGGKRAMQALLILLKDEVRDVRGSAVTALGKLGAKEAVGPLLEALQDEDSIIRACAVAALGQVGAKEVIGPLVSALRDKARGVRRNAATALRRLVAKEAIGSLLGALPDEGIVVRISAADPLGRLGPKDAVGPMLGALHDEDSFVRSCAANLLGRLGAKEAVGPLLGALHDEDSVVRSCAVTALRRLGAKEAVGPLLDVLHDEDSVSRASAATALGRLGAKEAVIPLVLTLCDKADNVRGSAATALGRLGGKEAVGPLLEALRDKASDVRGSAARALGRLDAKKAVGPLLEALRDEASKVRSRAAGALSRITSGTALPQVAEILDIVLAEQPCWDGQRAMIARQLLHSAFRSGDLNLVRRCVDIMLCRIADADNIFKPYTVALRFLDSGRDPASLEREQPEVREAANLLIDLFSQCCSKPSDAMTV